MNQAFVRIDEPINLTQPFSRMNEIGKKSHDGWIIIGFWLNNQIDPIQNGLYSRNINDKARITRLDDFNEGSNYYNTIFYVWSPPGTTSYICQFDNQQSSGIVGTHAPITSGFDSTRHTIQTLMLRAIMSRLVKLEEKIEELRYQPGSNAAKEAENNFNLTKRKREEEKEEEPNKRIKPLDED
jgi:hypothetical protein